MDRETNLYYNYFRDYDPGLGRFVQFDPIGLRGGINGFVYVDADPLVETDPEGLVIKNKPAPLPGTPWKGTKIPFGPALDALLKMERCLSVSILISGGSECTDDGRHVPGGVLGSRHCTEQAFDILISWVQSHDTDRVFCCAKQSGIKYIEKDPYNYHFQTVPGKGNKGGLLPHNCGCP